MNRCISKNVPREDQRPMRSHRVSTATFFQMFLVLYTQGVLDLGKSIVDPVTAKIGARPLLTDESVIRQTVPVGRYIRNGQYIDKQL